MSKLLLISSCTKDKAYKGFNIAKLPHSIEQLRINTNNPKLLAKYGSKAKDLYLGQGHKYILQALDNFKANHIAIDWRILSAGYGLINPNKVIVPYDITFNIQTDKQIIESSNKLHLAKDVEKAIKQHNVVIFCLPHFYLKAIQFNKINGLNKSKTLIFIDNLDSYKLNKPIYKLLDKANVKVWLVNKHEDISVEYDCFREEYVLEVSENISDVNDLTINHVKIK